MDPSHLILAQTLSLSGLVGATGGYAGLVRRRHERQIAMQTSAAASQTALDRVDRSMALSRLRRTFSPSVYQRRDGTSAEGPHRIP